MRVLGRKIWGKCSEGKLFRVWGAFGGTKEVDLKGRRGKCLETTKSELRNILQIKIKYKKCIC